MDFEILGFCFVRAEQQKAWGEPIPRDLEQKGFVQKNNLDGIPSYYVKPSQVWLYVEFPGGKKQEFNVYDNIMALYPERQKMTLKLAQDTFVKIVTGKIRLLFLEDGEPFLERVPARQKKAKTEKKA